MMSRLLLPTREAYLNFLLLRGVEDTELGALKTLLLLLELARPVLEPFLPRLESLEEGSRLVMVTGLEDVMMKTEMIVTMKTKQGNLFLVPSL